MTSECKAFAIVFLIIRCGTKYRLTSEVVKQKRFLIAFQEVKWICFCKEFIKFIKRGQTRGCGAVVIPGMMHSLYTGWHVNGLSTSCKSSGYDTSHQDGRRELGELFFVLLSSLGCAGSQKQRKIDAVKKFHYSKHVVYYNILTK